MFGLKPKKDTSELERLRVKNERLQAENRRLEAALDICYNEIKRLNSAMQKAVNDLETLNLARQFDGLATFRGKQGG